MKIIGKSHRYSLEVCYKDQPKLDKYWYEESQYFDVLKNARKAKTFLKKEFMRDGNGRRDVRIVRTQTITSVVD